MSLQFRDLPTEMKEEIATHLSAEDMTRFLSSNRLLRNESYQLPKFQAAVSARKARIAYEREMRRKGLELRKELGDKAYRAISQVNLKRLLYRPQRAKAYFAMLLGYGFPFYEVGSQVILNGTIGTLWIKFYLRMNKLYINKTDFIVNRDLEQLGLHYNWKEGETRKWKEVAAIIADNLATIEAPSTQEFRFSSGEAKREPLELPSELLYEVEFVSSYFRELNDYFTTIWEKNLLNDNAPEVEEFLEMLRYGELLHPPEME